MKKRLEVTAIGNNPKNSFTAKFTTKILCEEENLKNKKDALLEEIKEFAFRVFDGNYEKENIEIKLKLLN